MNGLQKHGTHFLCIIRSLLGKESIDIEGFPETHLAAGTKVEEVIVEDAYGLDVSLPLKSGCNRYVGNALVKGKYRQVQMVNMQNGTEWARESSTSRNVSEFLMTRFILSL